MNLSDMHIVLTGACGGIGQQSAKALAEAGARIIAVGRDQSRLRRLIDKLPRYLSDHAEHDYLVADINDDKQRIRLVQQLKNRKCPPNTLINMAGVNQFQLFERLQEYEVDQVINTNICSVLHLTRLMIPLLKQQPAARILNVGSTFGSIGYPGYVSYCTSKFALRGFSEALGRELADSSIRVQYFAPRATSTALNSGEANALNLELKNSVDEPYKVAKALVSFLNTKENNRYLGWPERLFIRINALFPSLVGLSIVKQLGTVKAHAPNEICKEVS
ncbi:MAG: SDR family oxidoreductase [Motiliproteus sp.]|nr:SDR family oxidoreductase [Motiliproteus sp.]MCW9052628.1 SDR family oxidoreductase [Motiliproteus sp.]